MLFILKDDVRARAFMSQSFLVSLGPVFPRIVSLHLLSSSFKSLKLPFFWIDRPTSDELDNWLHKPDLIALDLHENASEQAA